MSSLESCNTWMMEFCVTRKPKTPVVIPAGTTKAKASRIRMLSAWRFCPSSDGELWVSYAIGAAFLEMKADSIRNLVGKMDPKYRHPCIRGLFKLTGLETVQRGDTDDDGEET